MILKCLRLATVFVTAGTATLALANDPAPGDGAPGIQVREENFRAWNMRCETRNDLASRTTLCGLISTVTLQDETGKTAVALKIMLRPLPRGDRLQLSFELPIGVWLPSGAALAGPGAEALHLPFVVCRPTACEAGLVLSSDQIGKLSAIGDKATAIYQLQSQKTVKLAFSMEGFNDGLKALQHTAGRS